MVWFLKLSLWSKKYGFKLEINKDLTFIVIIIDIDWYENNYRDNFWGHIAQPYFGAYLESDSNYPSLLLEAVFFFTWCLDGM